MRKGRRGALIPPANASLSAGCAAAGLGAPPQKAVLEEREGPIAGWPAATGMGSLREREPAGYGPGHLLLCGARKGKEQRQQSLLVDWNGKGVWAWLSSMPAVLEIPLPVPDDFQRALHVVFLQLFGAKTGQNVFIA